MKPARFFRTWIFGYCLLTGVLLASLLWSAEVTVKGIGEYQGAPDLMINGLFPEQGSAWDGEGCVFWTERSTFFVIDLGSVVQLNDLLIQVDNNDTYRMDYSEDGKSYHQLVQIDAEIGEIEAGMETLSSQQGHPEYAAEIDFKPVQCQFLKIFAVEGDDAFSIAEIQAMTSPVAMKILEVHIPRISVRAIGEAMNPAALIMDGKWVDKGAAWDSPECVYWEDPKTALLIDLGSVRTVQELAVQVDNNDTYRVDYSVDGSHYLTLCVLDMGVGEVESGMDIFSSLSGHADYLPGIDFKPVQARFLKLFAVEGDGSYSAAEVQITVK